MTAIVVASTALTSCRYIHFREKIVDVTERVSCSYPYETDCRSYYAIGPYYDSTGAIGGTYRNARSAVWSGCIKNGISDQKFKELVNSGEYHIKSSSPWSRKITWWNTGTDSRKYINDGLCLGSRYIVSY